MCEVGDDPSNIPAGFTATPSSRPQTTTIQETPMEGIETVQPPQSTTSTVSSRGRPPLNRTSTGRFNTSYRPRGRPPLYGRHRFERPNPTSTSAVKTSPPKEIKDVSFVFLFACCFKL